MKPEVLVFVMQGCPACSQLKPLAEKMATHYGACVDTKIIDVDSDAGLSDAMGVEETPTVIGVGPDKRPVARMVGHDGKADRIIQVYGTVLSGATACRVQPFKDV
jgi:thioredoxin-like negative regulator of GroEL